MILNNEKHFDIILYNVTYLNKESEAIKNKVITIKDGYICNILDNKDGIEADCEIDCKDMFVMPGLVDGHLHTSQQLLRGRLLDEKPVIWKRVNVPFESNLNEETSQLSAQVAALEMITNGTTGFVDIGGKYVESFADVYEKSGLRGRLTYMTNDSPFAPKALTITPKEGLARLIELNKNHTGLLKGYFSVPSLTGVTTEMIHTIFSEAINRDIPIETHMNEYASEVFDFIERYGERPFEYMENQGLMSDKFVAAHCIFLSESEKEIIKKYDTKIIHCPFSNCGKGVPETPQLLKQGISVGFGTDGSAHGGLDLFKEIRLFRGVMNISHGISKADPQIMPAETLLKMATQGSSAALFEENIGAIKEGNKADIIAIDIMKPHLFPTQNIVHTITESACGNDVAHMIVNGKLLMKNREVLTLDQEKVMYNCKNYMEKYPHLAHWK